MPEDQPELPLQPRRREADRLRGVELPPPEDGGVLLPRWQPHHSRNILGAVSRLVVLLIVLAMLLIPFTPLASTIKDTLKAMIDRSRNPKVVIKEVPRDVVKEVIREVPKLEPLPSKFVARKEVDVASLFNDITIETKLQTSEGTYASLEAGNADAYKVKFELQLHVPKANQTVDELARLNAHLPKMLPGLGRLLGSAKVSGFYHKLYELKVARVQRDLTHLNRLLDRHNFFDCETILELQSPETKRRAILFQSDMDVVADGSDGDRQSEMGSDIYNSDYYQPFTSYEWPKQGTTANPLLGKFQSRYETLKKERESKNTSTSRKTELKAQMQNLDVQIKALKNRSSLIGEKDPFIVISLLFKDYPRILPQTPALGDYAAVIHGDKIYPAICGDYGPSYKMGEASLMIAKKCSARATPYNRGEDDLKVTYLVFPGTADKPFGPPDLDKWHEKISAYLKEMGGVGEGYSVYKWESPFPKPKPPEPTVLAGQKKNGAEGTAAAGSGAAGQETVKPAVPAEGAVH